MNVWLSCNFTMHWEAAGSNRQYPIVFEKPIKSSPPCLLGAGGKCSGVLLALHIDGAGRACSAAHEVLPHRKVIYRLCLVLSQKRVLFATSLFNASPSDLIESLPGSNPQNDAAGKTQAMIVVNPSDWM